MTMNDTTPDPVTNDTDQPKRRRHYRKRMRRRRTKEHPEIKTRDVSAQREADHLVSLDDLTAVAELARRLGGPERLIALASVFRSVG